MNVLNFKIIFLLFLVASVFSNTHASDSKIAKSAPIEIQLNDTGTFTFPKLKIDSITSTDGNNGIVEDTIPPCDIIFYKSGKLEYCKIIETTPETVTYKMCDYQNGPNIVAYKSSIQKIRYANGREDLLIDDQQKFDTTPNFVKPHKDPMAVWALISSLSSPIFPIGALVGIILGSISVRRISRSNGKLKGRGMAKVGILIGIIVIIILFSSL
jgi:hypothetical protein